MRAVVIYESIYGNTHRIADEIAAGLQPAMEVEVVPAAMATPSFLDGADLLVVGGPTHAHSLPRQSTREEGVRKGRLPDSGLEIDPDAEDPGLREWFETLSEFDGRRAAAFDTRMDMNPALTGRASKGIAKRLRRHGFDLVAEPESFLVDHGSHLVAGEAERARAWAETLRNVIAA